MMHDVWVGNGADDFAALAELFGCAGFDYLVLDAEHAPQTPPMILAQIQALASTPATPITKVSQL